MAERLTPEHDTGSTHFVHDLGMPMQNTTALTEATAALVALCVAGCAARAAPKAPAPAADAESAPPLDPAQIDVLAEAASAHLADSCKAARRDATSTTPVVTAEKDCRSQNAQGCLNLGVLYMCEVGVARNPPLAISMFE